jgi:transposase
VEELLTLQVAKPSHGPEDASQPVELSSRTQQLNIRARTARRWLANLGFQWKKVRKGVYIDGHERADVVAYRENEFLPKFKSIQHLLVTFDDHGNMILPENLAPGEKPHIPIAHDESTFKSNDGKRDMWMEDGKQPLRPKGQGKGIMVSDFIHPGGRLRVPDHLSDTDLEARGLPRRFATEYLEYGKDNYWNSEKMIQQVLDVALPIFRAAFPGFIGVWIFDNSTNHGCFAPDALRAEKLNLGPGGKQPLLRNGFIHRQQIWQSMQFPSDYHDINLAGKPKGIRQILKERGLWPPEGLRLDCRLRDGKSTGCQPEGGCCARKVLAEEQDFREQKGQLCELLEAQGEVVLFLPKFHCELNPIEHYWCQAKWYCRENCAFTFDGLRSMVPQSLASVKDSTILGFWNRIYRAIDTYQEGIAYGTEEFKNRVYKSHRRIEDKRKW